MRPRCPAPCLSAVLLLVLASGVMAASPDSAPALPPPAGRVITVSTEAQLQAAMGALTSGTTVMIAPGTYALTGSLFVAGALTDVTIRGATDRRDDVVLVGKGMRAPSNGGVPYGIWAGDGATRLTIANLTIRDVYAHAIIFNAGAQAPHVYNVRLVDAGQQFLKANPDGSGGGVNDGVVEYSVFEYDTTARDWYTNAVDVHTGRDWVVRHNLFRRIRAPQGQLAGPAILAWNGSRGTLVEGNTFVDCQREISLGLEPRTPDDHQGGTVRNNMIVRAAGLGGDVAIAVFDSPGTAVVHNTILLNGTYASAIEYRFADTTGVVVRHNLADRPALAREGAVATEAGNAWTATAALFVDAAAGNLHLADTATLAIDRAAAGDAAVDWDLQPRPAGAAPDLGADEFATATPRAPGAPAQFTARLQQGTARLAWLPPITGGPITDYVLEVGLAPGTTAATLPLGLATALSVPGVTSGRYFLRVRGRNAAGTGPASNEAAVAGGCTGPPVPPAGLRATASGGAITISWADRDGCEGTVSVLLVGTAPATANLGAVPVAGTRVAAQVAAGTYYVRVAAANARGTTIGDGELRLPVDGGACPPPAVPMTLAVTTEGTSTRVSWDTTDTAAATAADALAPLTFVLEAGSAPGLADLAIVDVGRTTAVAATLPPGTYHLRVRPRHACGTGAPSNEVAVRVS